MNKPNKCQPKYKTEVYNYNNGALKFEVNGFEENLISFNELFEKRKCRWN